MNNLYELSILEIDKIVFTLSQTLYFSIQRGREPILKTKPKPKKEHQVISSYKNALKKGQKTNSHKVTHAKKLRSSGKAYSGKLETRRYYGKSGKAQVDIHYSNHGYPKTHSKVPHRHNWGWIKGNWAPGKGY